MNTGIAMSGTKYVFIVDSDDYLPSNVISNYITILFLFFFFTLLFINFLQTYHPVWRYAKTLQ